MGSNKNKNQNQATGYGANPSQSGTDPKGQMQNATQYQQQRYESQQGPVADAMAYNYGRGTESDYGNYTDIMNNYRQIASGGGSSGGGGGGGGGAASQYDAFTVDPERVSAQQVNSRGLAPLERISASKMGPLQQATYDKLGNNIERVTASDPYNSYGGFQEFSQTGGYSPQDMNNLRARGTSPIRAAYANAERNVGQQRALQGGYSPNAIATQAKMAREQGQSMADAGQNVEAGIVANRNAGRVSGLQGMSGIEQARQNAQMQGDIFNAGQANLGRQFDITNQGNASQFNAGQANQARQFDVGNELDASKYNANQAFQGQQFDIGNELDASKANAGNALTAGTFNADLGMKGQMYNADARTQAQARNNASAESAAARNSAAAAQDNSDRLRALAGMSNLYGTTPGMSSMFGNQVAGIVGQGGTMGLGILNAQNQSQQLPGQYEQTRGRVNDMIGYANAAGNAIAPLLNNQNQGRQPIPSSPVQMSQNPYDILRNQPQYQMSLPPQQPSYYDEGDYGY